LFASLGKGRGRLKCERGEVGEEWGKEDRRKMGMLEKVAPKCNRFLESSFQGQYFH